MRFSRPPDWLIYSSVVFVLVLAVLLARPQGLFGRTFTRTV